MTAVAQKGPAFAPREFDAQSLGRLTWLGLALAAIGWAVLLGGATLTDFVDKGRAPTPTFHGDLVDIAKCLIGSGFGLAIVGALQSGFGALDRFFSAVLMRSSQRQTGSQEPEAASADGAIVVDATAPRAKRPYRLLSDGSVEVETILGTRRFDSMAEAFEFI